MRRDQFSKHRSVFNLPDLGRFMAVVQYRHFGRAAKSLNTTQPGLSRSIAALEQNLGSKLFSRTHRQIELTAAGELLVREARELLARAALAERTMRDAARGARGHVRFGTRSTARFTLVPPAIRGLRRLHPHFSVTVADLSQVSELERVRNGELDLTVLRGPMQADAGLLRARLRSDPMVVALPESHRFVERRDVDPRDLAGEPFVELTRYESLGYRELARGVCAQAGFVPDVVQEAATVDTLALCVSAGIGVALMHDARREIPIEGIVYRPIRPSGPPVELNAIWRANDENPVIGPFVRCLAAAASS
jgi:DNA-binding transcriptional LysR family regulator